MPREFIANIDEANGRVNELEAEQGLPRSEFIDNLDRANARIVELEGRSTTKPTTAKSAAAGGNLMALSARRLQLCAALGIDARYQPQCETVEDYQTQITRLETRYNASKVAPSQPVVPAKQVRPTVVATMTRFRSGKTSGLEKALGAATVRDNA